jgi:hypothetical protein
MFNLEQSITEWRKQMLAAGIKTPVPLAELEIHLREQVDQLGHSGLADEKAFQLAVQQLGLGKDLEAEFAKASHARLWLRGNPATLHMLAAWFFLMGLSSLTFLPNLWLAGFSFASFRTILCLALFGLQVLIGMGISRRSNFWRGCALAWTALYAIVCLFLLRPFAGISGHLIFSGFHFPADLMRRIETLSRWQIELFTRMADFRHVLDFLSPVVLIWGCYLLSKSPVRNLFYVRAGAENN